MGHGKSKHKHGKGFFDKVKDFGKTAAGVVGRAAPLIGMGLAPILGPETMAIGSAIGGVGSFIHGQLDTPGGGKSQVTEPGGQQGQGVITRAQGMYKEGRKRLQQFDQQAPMASKFMRTNLGRARQNFENRDIVRHSRDFIKHHSDKGMMIHHQFRRMF